jgi:hypothetical protein
MTRAYGYRDAELRSLSLRSMNRAGDWLAGAGIRIPSLDPDSIVRAAGKRAGTSDLGGDSYREPLEIYLRAAEEEADLTTFGRLALRGMLVGSLANRAALHQWARDHSEVREESIERPWIIAGLPRTGTTLLANLLSLDPMARSPLHWEAASPAPPATLADAYTDPRIAENEKQNRQLLALNPALAAMHDFGAMLAQECVGFFMYDVRTLGVETQALVPSYGRWLETCDMTPAYAWHRLALQTLQAAQPTERWVLKTPNHLWCLDTLLATYPDARIIWTHRDPGPVVSSLASLVNTLQRLFTRREDPRPTAEEWKRKALHAVQSGMAFDEKADDGWCHHVAYTDLMADPVAVVRRIHAHWGEEVSPLHARRMEAWMRERPQAAFGRHVYDPADFGWSYEQLAEEFGAYRERFGVAKD